MFNSAAEIKMCEWTWKYFKNDKFPLYKVLSRSGNILKNYFNSFAFEHTWTFVEISSSLVPWMNVCPFPLFFGVFF